MKKGTKFLILIVILMSCSFLYSQDSLEAIVTWKLYDNEEFRCSNPNVTGSDINNDGYDDYIHWNPGDPYTFQFFMGSAVPDTTFDFEIEVPFGSSNISWGGDLDGDGYKDIIYTVCTDWGDPGDIYICLGGEEIDLDPELILHGGDYIPDATGLNYSSFNGGYDFNGDGYDDLLTWGRGPSLWWNGLVQIFLGGEELSATPDFQIQGNIEDEFGRTRAVGDINGDGFDDLIVSRKAGPNDEVKFEVYLGGEIIDTIPDFITNEIFELHDYYSIAYAKGDVNNDGFDDVLISSLGIFLGNQNGSLILNYPTTESLRYVNLNDDEYDDVLSYAYGNLDIFYGSDNFDLYPEIILSSNNRSFCNIGDFNNDGEDEILVNISTTPENTATMYGLPGGSFADEDVINSNYKLKNYPNPFKNSTKFVINTKKKIEDGLIKIYNLKGELVKKIAIEKNVVKWDGKNTQGKNLPSGIYFYKFISKDEQSKVKKMILIK